jgi:glycosyl transferase family 25
MDIVVINLDAHAERWRETHAAFAALGLDVRRLPAVCGDRLASDELAGLADPALNRRQHHKPLRPGEIGCYASHMAAWRQLLKSRAALMAVFEDDVELSPELPGVLQALEAAAPQWDVVKLFGRQHESARERRGLLADADLISYRRVPSHTCAYVISRRGAHKLLASRQPFGRPVDIDMRHWWENGLTVLGVQPYPVRAAARSLDSTIDAGRRGCSGLPMRLRKLWLQARYTLLNAYHAGLAGRSGHTSPSGLFGEPATPRDAA